MDSNDIGVRSNVCNEYLKYRELPNALMNGTKAMVDAGEKFTPRYPAEDLQTYQLRLKGVQLFNGFELTVQSMLGKIFARDVMLNDDVPETIATYAENIDGQGRNLTMFALDVMRAGLVDGISFVYADFPKVQTADGTKPFLTHQIANGARPNAIHYKADQILGFAHSNIDGKEQLTQVRILEYVTDTNSLTFSDVIIEQIKVLNIGSYQIYRRDENSMSKDWVLYDEGSISLSYIPLIPFYVNRTNYMLGKPPLRTLAEMNLEHWISSSEQRKALIFERFAMIVFTGVPPGTDIPVGPDKIICLTDPMAKWGTIESSGKGLEAGRLDIENIERRMQTASMTINLQNKTAGVTATEVVVDTEEANSALMSIVASLEDCLANMLQAFADYELLDNGGTVTINKEFGRRKSKLSVNDFVALMLNGIVSSQTIFQELQRRGDLSEDLNYDDVSAQSLEDTIKLMGLQKNDNNSL